MQNIPETPSQHGLGRWQSGCVQRATDTVMDASRKVDLYAIASRQTRVVAELARCAPQVSSLHTRRMPRRGCTSPGSPSRRLCLVHVSNGLTLRPAAVQMPRGGQTFLLMRSTPPLTFDKDSIRLTWRFRVGCAGQVLDAARGIGCGHHGTSLSQLPLRSSLPGPCILLHDMAGGKAACAASGRMPGDTHARQ